jgi:uncharacterized membrane protein (DUF373 family)
LAKTGGKFHEELSDTHNDPLIRGLHKVIRQCVRVLAILMVIVIIWGTADVIYVMYQKVVEPPLFLVTVNDILTLFGAFMVVLIAIEIFVNIRLYLGTDVLPVQLVIATALMAMARKVIVLDFASTDATYLLAIGVVIIALGLTHWLLSHENVSKAALDAQVIPPSSSK